MTYISNKSGMIWELNALAKELWLWADAKDINIQVAFLKGIDNKAADKASRIDYTSHLEWGISPKVFDIIEKVYGKLNIDLFAYRVNTKIPAYVSWKPDTNVQYIDAFTDEWHKNFNYIFPPFNQIMSLNKLERC